MKLIYVTNIREDISPGYKEKIYSQVKALNKLGFEAYLYISGTKGVSLYKVNNEEYIKIFSKDYKYNYNNKNERLLDKTTLKSYREFIDGLYAAYKIINPDVVYIRRIIPVLNKFLKYINHLKENRKIVIYEYPTFPWEKELINAKKFLLYFIEKLHYKKLINSIDLATAILGQEIKLPTKFIEITNGIDINNLETKKIIKYDNKINLIGVARMEYWHGYDRVIEGLNKFYSNNKNQKIEVNFYAVGEGPELNNLKALVNKYKLNEHVTFFGMRKGNQLNELFDTCQLAVGSLGMYRQDIDKASTLKTKEFCGRGIPFIIAYDETGFDNNFKYIMKISNDNEPLDINNVIEFYENVYRDDDFVNYIREYADKNLNWESIMKPVVNEILTICNKNKIMD